MKLDSGVKKGLKHRLRFFDAVCKLKQRWKKWLTAECWTDIINERHDVPANLKFDGFKCKVQQKICYVDGHEKPETKKHGQTMVCQHLENELWMHRWIQLPVTELKDPQNRARQRTPTCRSTNKCRNG
jgi:hypothetical protein